MNAGRISATPLGTRPDPEQPRTARNLPCVTAFAHAVPASLLKARSTGGNLGDGRGTDGSAYTPSLSNGSPSAGRSYQNFYPRPLRPGVS
jgi:hypothetical protein